MSIAAGLALVVLSISLMLGAMVAVRLVGDRLRLGPETRRKLVHVSTGIYALTLPLTFHARWPVVLLIIASIAVMLALRIRTLRGGLASTLHAVERKSYGEIYLALAVGFLFFQSQGQPILYVLPILTLTLSDAAAALVGTSYGRKRFPVEAGHKSVEGVVAFFVVTWLLAMTLLLAMTDSPRLTVIMLSLLVAAFGALVEADSWRGLDNLFIPLAVHFLLVGRLEAPVESLIVLAFGFVVSIAAIILAAPMLRLTVHAARAYGILVFLVFTIAGPIDALAPLAAILAHVVAQRVRPSLSDYPDLDLLAVVAGACLFWLFVGRYFGRDASDLFDLTFVALAAIFVALALEGFSRWWLPLVPAGAAAFALAITEKHPDYDGWHGALWPWLAIALVLSLAPAAWPALFDRYRTLRALALAAAAPILLFVWKGVLA